MLVLQKAPVCCCVYVSLQSFHGAAANGNMQVLSECPGRCGTVTAIRVLQCVFVLAVGSDIPMFGVWGPQLCLLKCLTGEAVEKAELLGECSKGLEGGW